MIKKSNPFFVVNGERDERPARRLYARFEHRSGGSLIFEAVDGDWMDQFLGEGANPDLWRDIGPEAPVSILEIERRDRYWLRKSPIYDRENARRWVELVIGERGLEISQYLNLFAGPRKICVEKAMTADDAKQRAFPG
jgi:hypothetical protein